LGVAPGWNWLELPDTDFVTFVHDVRPLPQFEYGAFKRVFGDRTRWEPTVRSQYLGRLGGNDGKASYPQRQMGTLWNTKMRMSYELSD